MNIVFIELKKIVKHTLKIHTIQPTILSFRKPEMTPHIECKYVSTFVKVDYSFVFLFIASPQTAAKLDVAAHGWTRVPDTG